MGCLYNNSDIGEVVNCIEQNVMCYLTACDREQHMLAAAEGAITGYLIPKVEELLTEDSMNGGSHDMARKFHQGQTGLFYNGNAYLVNYQFAKGAMCEAYKKAGILPMEDARTVDYEGNKLLDMTEALSGGMGLVEFVKKYRRNITLKYRDRLLQGLGLSLQHCAEHGYPPDELVDVFAYQNGVTFWITADKKVMDSAMYVFIGWNRQALGFGRPRLENGALIAGEEVRRYDIVYEFTLVDPARSSDQMKLTARIDLVYGEMDGARRVRNVTVGFTPEESARITAIMKRRYFPAIMPVEPHKAPVTIGQEFLDNYYYEHGTPEQKKSVEDKWASTDTGFRRILELSRINKNK